MRNNHTTWRVLRLGADGAFKVVHKLEEHKLKVVTSFITFTCFTILVILMICTLNNCNNCNTHYQVWCVSVLVVSVVSSGPVCQNPRKPDHLWLLGQVCQGKDPPSTV